MKSDNLYKMDFSKNKPAIALTGDAKKGNSQTNSIENNKPKTPVNTNVANKPGLADSVNQLDEAIKNN